MSLCPFPVTDLRPDVLTAHAQKVSSQQSPTTVSRVQSDHIFIGRRVRGIPIRRHILNRK